MAKVYGAPLNHYTIATEIEEIEAKLHAEAKRGNVFTEWYEMIYTPRMGYRLALGILLQMFQQLTGANYFFYYGTVIFKATGINNSFVTQMILNGINFGVTVSVIIGNDKFLANLCSHSRWAYTSLRPTVAASP